MKKSVVPVAMTVVTSGAFLALVGCSAQPTNQAGVTTSGVSSVPSYSPAAQTTPAATSPDTSASPTSVAISPATRLPSVIPTAPAVTRTGALPSAQRTSASPVPYASAAKYSDGVTLTITGIRRWTITERGAGALTGKPATTFTVAFTNGSRVPINLNAVVVSAAYGDQAVAAPPVYSDPTLSDFSGTLQPGKTSTATYAFSVPDDQSLDTTLWVDFDGRHTPATFSGSLRG